MKFKLQLTVITLITLMSLNLFAAENVAKVVLMRGMVKAKLGDGSVVDVKADQSIPEGALVQTADKSFVKLLFIDKSQMNLGPNSQMIITAFPKKAAGIITLVKGQIRSQVTKDYMEMSDKSKSKLYIKTKTAAMGIRGTDFQVNFNPENQNTALITFEGKVVMSHLEKSVRENSFDQNALEKVVSSDKAVTVTQGQISAVNLNVAERAMIPTKLGTAQIAALESNETGLKESSGVDSKQFRNPIPPGADGSAFSNTGPTLDKEIAKMGIEIRPSDIKTADKTSVAEGFFNVSTGEYKLPAGSIIDLSTVNIIPPPTNAVFDKNSGTYVVPETFGKVDKGTGEYRAPAGLELGVDGKFIVVDPDAFKKAQQPVKGEEKSKDKKDDKKSDDKASEKKEGDVSKTENSDDRSPASLAPSDTLGVKPPEMFVGGIAQTFITTFAAPVVKPMNPPPPPTGYRDVLSGIATDVLQQNDVAKQTIIERGVTIPTTKTKFIFNAQ